MFLALSSFVFFSVCLNPQKLMGTQKCIGRNCTRDGDPFFTVQMPCQYLSKAEKFAAKWRKNVAFHLVATQTQPIFKGQGWAKKVKNIIQNLSKNHIKHFVTKLVLFMLSLHFRVPKLVLFMSSLLLHAQSKFAISEKRVHISKMKTVIPLCLCLTQY